MGIKGHGVLALVSLPLGIRGDRAAGCKFLCGRLIHPAGCGVSGLCCGIRA
ncbi:hypothetical protein Salmuc_01028 [Salipiger mucosus DSM 16094]|uniref:Uncharacterized protein n=1 Tax=Salipiger mucosus DSM 16094 TaxID=1123237 RepID=S9QPJ3_9RHOB|nr:hypothetical protein Salmuc_01028 [Salipiger mucosus DSM 16094]